VSLGKNPVALFVRQVRTRASFYRGAFVLGKRGKRVPAGEGEVDM